MTYEYKCELEECSHVFEVSFSLKEYETFSKRKGPPMQCPRCGTHNYNFERQWHPIGIKFIGDWYATTGKY
jgi:hypothetical protein